ncbi:MAG: hypothetical protein R3E12_04995 [Candidatus Eisenbacteria bacterium]
MSHSSPPWQTMLRRPGMRLLCWPPLAAGLLLGAPCLVQAAPDPVSGLDSLTTATLERALDYMQILPPELGFDKRYVEDDTFRLGIVDALLEDPLRLPDWQAEAVTAIRDRANDPEALLAWGGQTIDATGDLTATGSAPESWIAAESSTMSLDAAVQTFLADVERAQTDLDRAFAAIDADTRRKLLIVAPALWGDADHPLDKIRKGCSIASWVCRPTPRWS